MRIVVALENWLAKLAEAIETSSDGDVIVVMSESTKELGKRAKARMYPLKDISFEVDPETYAQDARDMFVTHEEH